MNWLPKQVNNFWCQPGTGRQDLNVCSVFRFPRLLSSFIQVLILSGHHCYAWPPGRRQKKKSIEQCKALVSLGKTIVWTTYLIQ